MKSIIILSPSRYSLYTTIVAHLLLKKNVTIKSVIVVKLFNLKRIIGEFKRDKNKLIDKIYKKLFLRRNAYKLNNKNNLRYFLKENNIKYNCIENLAKEYNIPIIYCKTLNEKKILVILNNKNLMLLCLQVAV